MGDVRDAFERTVEALEHEDVDAAVVELGRTLADTIDSAKLMDPCDAKTKALYLTPHLMNVLKELLATPAARKEVSGAAKGVGASGTLASLRSLHGGRPA